MKRKIGDYLEDIIDAMDKAVRFVQDLSYEQFEHDDKTVFAVERALGIIGEAVKKIPDDVRKKYPEIPWKDIAGMRDKIIHDYFGTDLPVVWEIVKDEIPPVKPLFEKILRELEE